MKVVLVGAELEENLGLRYMASSLERDSHAVVIVPFNSSHDITAAAEEVCRFGPQIVGPSMVFTSRGREFCCLAQTLRSQGYAGHIIAGGHFAALNAEKLLHDFPAFDSVALGEGEEIICALARHLNNPSTLAGLCYRLADGSIGLNPSTGNPDRLDSFKISNFYSFVG